MRTKDPRQVEKNKNLETNVKSMKMNKKKNTPLLRSRSQKLDIKRHYWARVIDGIQFTDGTEGKTERREQARAS